VSDPLLSPMRGALTPAAPGGLVAV